jgi:hypothetical protein
LTQVFLSGASNLLSAPHLCDDVDGSAHEPREPSAQSRCIVFVVVSAKAQAAEIAEKSRRVC